MLRILSRHRTDPPGARLQEGPAWGRDRWAWRLQHVLQGSRILGGLLNKTYVLSLYFARLVIGSTHSFSCSSE
jgi:hypothetical protein